MGMGMGMNSSPGNPYNPFSGMASNLGLGGLQQASTQLMSGLGQNSMQTATQAHGQLMNFGKNTHSNINGMGQLMGNTHQVLMQSFNDANSVNLNALKQYGGQITSMIRMVSPALAGLWDGYMATLNTAAQGTNNNLSQLGDMVQGNMGHWGNHFAGDWQTFQNGVDGGIRAGLQAGAQLQAPGSGK